MDLLVNRAALVLLSLSAALTACPKGNDLRLDAGPGTDVGPADMGPADVGPTDAGREDVGVSDAGTDDAGAVSELPPGGFVLLAAESSGDTETRFGLAYFFESYTFEGVDPFARLPPRTVDECASSLIVSSTVTYAYRDIGAEITMSGAGEVHTFPRRVAGDRIDYGFQDFTDSRAPWSGGPITLTIPGAVGIEGATYPSVLDVPALDFTTTTTVVSSTIGASPIDFRWTAHGADSVGFGVYDGSSNFQCVCYVADDGAFTIPRDPCLATSVGDLTIIAIETYSTEVAFNERRLRVAANVGLRSVIPRGR